MPEKHALPNPEIPYSYISTRWESAAGLTTLQIPEVLSLPQSIALLPESVTNERRPGFVVHCFSAIEGPTNYGE